MTDEITEFLGIVSEHMWDCGNMNLFNRANELQEALPVTDPEAYLGPSERLAAMGVSLGVPVSLEEARKKWLEESVDEVT